MIHYDINLNLNKCVSIKKYYYYRHESGCLKICHQFIKKQVNIGIKRDVKIIPYYNDIS